jgi:hypothetical protein
MMSRPRVDVVGVDVEVGAVTDEVGRRLRGPRVGVVEAQVADLAHPDAVLAEGHADQAGDVHDAGAAVVEGDRHERRLLVELEDVCGAAVQRVGRRTDVADVPVSDLQRSELELVGDVVDVHATAGAGGLGTGGTGELVLDDEELALTEDRVVDGDRVRLVLDVDRRVDEAGDLVGLAGSWCRR